MEEGGDIRKERDTEGWGLCEWRRGEIYRRKGIQKGGGCVNGGEGRYTEGKGYRWEGERCVCEQKGGSCVNGGEGRYAEGREE